LVIHADLSAQILRLYRAERWRVGTIARQLHVHRDTVRRVLAHSQHVIVPLQCEPLALQTTTQILRAVRDASATNASLVLDGILLTMLEDGNAVSQRVAEYVRAQLPAELLFDVAIPRTMASIDAFAAGQPVVLRAPDDPASRAYTRLAEILDPKLQ